MTLTPYQIATRHMATEVEHINRLIYTKDLSVSKAKQMLADAAMESIRAASDGITREDPESVRDIVIKFGINAGRAWFNIL